MTRRVNLICAHLVDQGTGALLRGGAERYTIELARLFQDDGSSVRILHKARTEFSTEVEGFPVTGLKSPAGALGNFALSMAASRLCATGDLQVYVLAELGFPRAASPAIGVQHGVWWESDYPRIKRFANQYIQSSLARKFDAYVCVDTSFINWLYAQARGRHEYAHKLFYIPNFTFKPSASPAGRAMPEIPTILFPRRIEFFRGAVMFYDAMKQIWSSGRNYRARFCGDGVLLTQLQRLVQRDGFADLCSFSSSAMDSMGMEYDACDVVVVPSIAREGTSLSCIEAMSFGRPVVVTHVGGLCNLVIPGHNGLVVDLRVEDLARAIVRVVEDPVLRAGIVSNGLATAQALSRESWREQWRRAVETALRGQGTSSVFPRSGKTTGLQSGPSQDLRSKPSPPTGF